MAAGIPLAAAFTEGIRPLIQGGPAMELAGWCGFWLGFSAPPHVDLLQGPEGP